MCDNTYMKESKKQYRPGRKIATTKLMELNQKKNEKALDKCSNYGIIKEEQNERNNMKAKIEIQEFSRHWCIRVIKDGKIVRVHTGQSNNKSWKKKCLENLKRIYG